MLKELAAILCMFLEFGLALAIFPKTFQKVLADGARGMGVLEEIYTAPRYETVIRLFGVGCVAFSLVMFLCMAIGYLK